MSRVEIASTAWGYFYTVPSGAPRVGAGPTIQTLAGGAVTIYAAKTGATAYGGAFVTDASGLLPGWVEPGTYKLQEPLDLTWREVQAVSGEDALSVESDGAVWREAPVNANLAEYGISADGSTDDTAEWDALAAALPDQAEVTFTGASVIEPGREFVNRIHLIGQGGRSAFKIAGGNNALDGITLGGDDGLRWFHSFRDIDIFGGAACCRYALVLINLMDPIIDAKIRAGCTYGCSIEGLQNTKSGNCKISVDGNNSAMPYTGSVVPTNGVRIVGSALIPTNANHFDLVAQGLAGIGVLGDGTVGAAGSYNNYLRGVFQGNGGVEVSLKAWTDFSIRDTHIEDAADADPGLRLDSCGRGDLGGALTIDGDLDLIACYDLYLDGIIVRDVACPAGNARIRRGRVVNNGGTHTWAAGTSYSTERLTSSDTWNPGSIADGAVERNADWVTVTGARPGDLAFARFDLILPTGMHMEAHVADNDKVATTLVNRSGATQDIGAGNVLVDVTPQ